MTPLTTYHPVPPAVVRSAVKNIQVFNPTTNTLNVRWDPATGQVLQYRVVFTPVTGARPSDSVSFAFTVTYCDSMTFFSQN